MSKYYRLLSGNNFQEFHFLRHQEEMLWRMHFRFCILSRREHKNWNKMCNFGIDKHNHLWMIRPLTKIRRHCWGAGCNENLLTRRALNNWLVKVLLKYFAYSWINFCLYYLIHISNVLKKNNSIGNEIL